MSDLSVPKRRKRSCNRQVENALLKRALGFDYDEITKERTQDDVEEELTVTKVVTKTVLPDTTAQIFWLKNRKAKQWAERSRHDLKVGERNPASIGNMLVSTLEILACGDIDNKTAGSIISGCNAILSSIRTDEQQKKLDELEQLIRNLTNGS